MIDIVARLVGYPSVWLEFRLRRLLHGEETVRHREGTSEKDRTGILVPDGRRLPLLLRDEDIVYAGYESPAHSLWRAQELSLFHRNRLLLAPPILDFGCGDGSFSASVFDRLDIGVDNDAEALAAAGRSNLYDRLVLSTPQGIPLESGSAATIISNSVLEHVTDLDGTLKELRRTLRPGGRLVFTVPVVGFRDHLRKYFGRAESERVNVQYYHHNLFPPEEWLRRLKACGFEIEAARSFQPDWFTFWYRMLRLFSPKGLGRIIPSVPRILWQRAGGRLIRMVRRSLVNRGTGANLFAVARATGA